MRRLLPLALIAAVAVPAGVRAAIAQDVPAPRERTRTYSFFGPGGPGEVMTLMRRGRLGVTIDMRADASRDSIGALVADAARNERRSRRVHSAIGLAAAALLAAVTFVAVRPRSAPERDHAALDRAMLQSRAMEATLKSLAPDQRALNGATASVAADLEANLSKVDSALNDPGAWSREPDRVVELWRQRTGILSALVDVHAGHATFASF